MGNGLTSSRCSNLAIYLDWIRWWPICLFEAFSALWPFWLVRQASPCQAGQYGADVRLWSAKEFVHPITVVQRPCVMLLSAALSKEGRKMLLTPVLKRFALKGTKIMDPFRNWIFWLDLFYRLAIEVPASCPERTWNSSKTTPRSTVRTDWADGDWVATHWVCESHVDQF